MQKSRLELRVRPEEKAAIVRAARLAHTDPSSFIVRTVLPAAHAVIDQAERLELTERDSLRVLELLENPPQPNQRLLKAARDLPEAQ